MPTVGQVMYRNSAGLISPTPLAGYAPQYWTGSAWSSTRPTTTTTATQSPTTSGTSTTYYPPTTTSTVAPTTSPTSTTYKAPTTTTAPTTPLVRTPTTPLSGTAPTTGSLSTPSSGTSGAYPGGAGFGGTILTIQPSPASASSGGWVTIDNSGRVYPKSQYPNGTPFSGTVYQSNTGTFLSAPYAGAVPVPSTPPPGPSSGYNNSSGGIANPPYAPPSGSAPPSGPTYNLPGGGAPGTYNPGSGTVPAAPGAPGSSSGGTEDNSWKYYYETEQAAGLDPIAEARTGITNENFPSLASLLEGLPGAPDVGSIESSLNAEDLGPSGYMTNALNRMAGLEYDDFGIPQNVREQMKVAEAEKLNPQFAAQKEAARRMAAQLGLTADSGAMRGIKDIEQSRVGAVTKAQRDIDVASSLKANEQFLANLQNLIAGGTQYAQLGQEGARLAEASRQFNVGAGLDVARFGTAQAEAMERMRLNRAMILESVRNFLEDYELRRQRLAGGLVDAASTAANERNSQFIQSLYGPMNYGAATGEVLAGGL